MVRLRWEICLLAVLFGCSETAVPNQEVRWVKLAGGCFTIGDKPLYPEERPSREACVGPFEMTSTEITNAQFTAFTEATGYLTRAERGWQAHEPLGPGVALPPGSAVFTLPDGGTQRELDWWRMVEGANWREPQGPGSKAVADHPVVHVTREDAEAYAEWAGGRLPSEAEWEFAARASKAGSDSSWSNAEYAAQPSRANTWQGVFPVRNTNEDTFEGIAPVGSFPANSFGLFDMIGNVWEWTATPYAPSRSDRDAEIAGETGFDPGQPGARVGTIKGGSYLCADNYCARFRPAARQAQDLAFGTSHIGFRIARDTEQEQGAADD